MKKEKKKRLSKNDIDDIFMRNLYGMRLSNIWLSFWTLFLEFGKLNKEGIKWEISFMIDPSWKFQKGFQVLEHINQSREQLDKSLEKYIWKRLQYSVIDEYFYELKMDFGDGTFFTTLSTNCDIGEKYWGALCWTIFFNEHFEGYELEKLRNTMIRNDGNWIYLSKRGSRDSANKKDKKAVKKKGRSKSAKK